MEESENVDPMLFDADDDFDEPDDLKFALAQPNEEEYEELLHQLRARLDDEQGEILYEVGVSSRGENGLDADEMEASLNTLTALVRDANADLSLVREREVDGKFVAEYLVREKMDERDFLDSRVCVCGNVDAGKSTLLGVLTSGILDNGRGLARSTMFRHKHEKETGRTSSVSHNILGFDGLGKVVEARDHSGRVDWPKVCERASKVITFIDLAGHAAYLKTTMGGLMGSAPHFLVMVVAANAGILGTFKEHLGLALALRLPIVVVVTKIDMTPDNIREDTINLLTRILKSPGCRKIPVHLKSTDDVVVCARNFMSERICPIVQVSSVAGTNIDLLLSFLNLVSCAKKGERSRETEPPLVTLEENFSVPGVGTVVSGTVAAGVIRPNDVLLLGPDSLGTFQPVTIKSIQRKRLTVHEARAGQAASFALKKFKRAAIRRGAVLVGRETKPMAVREIDVELLVLHHPTTISVGYQAMVHCGNVRQTASLVRIVDPPDKDCLRTGDRAVVRLRFIRSPEYISSTTIVLREGRTKAVGKVVSPIIANKSVQTDNTATAVRIEEA